MFHNLYLSDCFFSIRFRLDIWARRPHGWCYVLSTISHKIPNTNLFRYWGCSVWSFGQGGVCQVPHCKGILCPLYLINNLWGGILRPCEYSVLKNLLPSGFSMHWWSLPVSVTTLGIAKWRFSNYILSIFCSLYFFLFLAKKYYFLVTLDTWIFKKIECATIQCVVIIPPDSHIVPGLTVGTHSSFLLCPFGHSLAFWHSKMF